MPQDSTSPLKPRKTPRQSRSNATIEAIFAASIQVLRTDGAAGFTTTRVAERAGVSVGTLYQYFPNGQALLYAVLSQHLGRLASIVEDACLRLEGRTLAEITDGLISAYLSAKTLELDASLSLYSASSGLDASVPVRDMTMRIRAAFRGALVSASDVSFADIDAAVFMLQNAISGTTRAVFESEEGPTPMSVAMLKAQLPIMCGLYLRAHVQPRLAEEVQIAAGMGLNHAITR